MHRTYLVFNNKNHYFNIGVSEIQRYIELNTERDVVYENLVFLDLSRYTLSEIVELMSQKIMYRIVIISAPDLLPVAHFWFKTNKQVVAVFSSNSSFSLVKDKILRFKKEERCFFSKVPKSQKLTFKEYNLMRLYLKKLDYSSILKKNDYVKSTLYTVTRRLCLKLKIRKISHLHIP